MKNKDYEKRLTDLIRENKDKEETLLLLLQEANRIFRELNEEANHDGK